MDICDTVVFSSSSARALSREPRRDTPSDERPEGGVGQPRVVASSASAKKAAADAAKVASASMRSLASEALRAASSSSFALIAAASSAF